MYFKGEKKMHFKFSLILLATTLHSLYKPIESFDKLNGKCWWMLSTLLIKCWKEKKVIFFINDRYSIFFKFYWPRSLEQRRIRVNGFAVVIEVGTVWFIHRIDHRNLTNAG